MKHAAKATWVLLLLACISSFAQSLWTTILEPRSVEYVVVGFRSSRYVTNNAEISLLPEIEELFRISDTNTIARLVEAIRLRPTEPNGGSFCGDFLSQCYIGTNGEVLLDVIIFEDGVVSWGLWSTASDGRIVRRRMNELHGDQGMNTHYTRIVFEQFTNRQPSLAAQMDEEYGKDGGLRARLHIDRTNAQPRATGGGSQTRRPLPPDVRPGGEELRDTPRAPSDGLQESE